MSDFGTFLDAKTKQEDSQAQFYIDAKKEWLSNINFVFSEIEAWLDEYKSKGIKFSYGSVHLTEEGIGNYAVQKQYITFRETTVTVEPKGCLFFGCKGSFIVTGPQKNNVSINLEVTRKDPSNNEPIFEWKICTGIDRQVVTKNFEKSVFLDELMNLMK